MSILQPCQGWSITFLFPTVRNRAAHGGVTAARCRDGCVITHYMEKHG